MKLCVLAPHFEPDVAPTGAVVTRIVHELAARGHHIEVVTALPWYRDHRVEPGWSGRWVRVEDTPWGKITRLHPFPAPHKRALARRAMAFAGFTALAASMGSRGDALDGVLAVSPPLTLALAGARVARNRGARFVFNVQDVFPDVTIELGYLKDRRAIAAARHLERRCYARADAITVLSEDLRDNVAAKTDPAKVHVIPNFVDADAIRPADRNNAYRAEFGLTDKKVVMYAGNVGLSQSVDLLIAAATALSDDPGVVFVINGSGAARSVLEHKARGLGNVVFVDMQPVERLPEVLAAADIHVVALKTGLGRSSVPSKTYSVFAAGRPVIASVDPGSEIARVVERSRSGVAIRPEDPEEFTKAVRWMLENEAETEEMGRAGRAFVEQWATPAAVAQRYEELFAELLEIGAPVTR